MLGSKIKNWNVIKMYRGDKQPYIETTITIRTPLRGKEIHQKFKQNPDKIKETLKGMNDNIGEIVGDTFESDVVSVYSGVRNFLSR